MAKRVLCKFFAHETCLKGEHCEFVHDWKSPQNNVCTFYQKGVCAYGSRCRYEHIKVSHSPSSGRSSSQVISSPVERPFRTAVSSAVVTLDVFAEHSSSTRPFFPPMSLDGDYNIRHLNNIDPSDQPMCSFAAVGDCPQGEKCSHIHGNFCPICGKQCLHPFRPHEGEEHVKKCERRRKHLEALRQSQEIECSVCLELILSKPTSAERKFGILSECDHQFCISCIRNWRSSSSTSGFDANSSLRTCPICRRISYFVIPSVIWFYSKDEKQDILESYKARLRSIDCKHFDFGNGSCPFGNSCFYRHAYLDGHLEEVVVRHLGAEDGNSVIAKEIRLPDFLGNLQIR